jgi:hypothetical protein
MATTLIFTGEQIDDYRFQIGLLDISFAKRSAIPAKVINDEVDVMIILITARNYRGHPSGHSRYSNATNNGTQAECRPFDPGKKSRARTGHIN